MASCFGARPRRPLLEDPAARRAARRSWPACAWAPSAGVKGVVIGQLLIAILGAWASSSRRYSQNFLFEEFPGAGDRGVHAFAYVVSEAVARLERRVEHYARANWRREKPGLSIAGSAWWLTCRPRCPPRRRRGVHQAGAYFVASQADLPPPARRRRARSACSARHPDGERGSRRHLGAAPACGSNQDAGPRLRRDRPRSSSGVSPHCRLVPQSTARQSGITSAVTEAPGIHQCRLWTGTGSPDRPNPRAAARSAGPAFDIALAADPVVVAGDRDQSARSRRPAEIHVEV